MSTIVTLEDMLGFKGVRPVASLASGSEVRIGVGYSWMVDAGVPSCCLKKFARVAQPGYFMAPRREALVSGTGTMGGQPGSSRHHVQRVAEILQRLVETSKPVKVSSPRIQSNDETPEETGAALEKYSLDFRRLTAEPPTQILESIASKMAVCDLFIFDLTDYARLAKEDSTAVTPNSNVLLEVGIALGMNVALRHLKLPTTPVILVQLDHERIRTPSDLEGISVFRYRLRQPVCEEGYCCGGFVLEYPCALRNTLREAIRAAVLSRASGRRR